MRYECSRWWLFKKPNNSGKYKNNNNNNSTNINISFHAICQQFPFAKRFSLPLSLFFSNSFNVLLFKFVYIFFIPVWATRLIYGFHSCFRFIRTFTKEVEEKKKMSRDLYYLEEISLFFLSTIQLFTIHTQTDHRTFCPMSIQLKYSLQVHKKVYTHINNKDNKLTT